MDQSPYSDQRRKFPPLGPSGKERPLRSAARASTSASRALSSRTRRRAYSGAQSVRRIPCSNAAERTAVAARPPRRRRDRTADRRRCGEGRNGKRDRLEYELPRDASGVLHPPLSLSRCLGVLRACGESRAAAAVCGGCVAATHACDGCGVAANASLPVQSLPLRGDAPLAMLVRVRVRGCECGIVGRVPTGTNNRNNGTGNRNNGTGNRNIGTGNRNNGTDGRNDGAYHRGSVRHPHA